jgi:hypothetical protein
VDGRGLGDDSCGVEDFFTIMTDERRGCAYVILFLLTYQLRSRGSIGLEEFCILEAAGREWEE